MRTVTTTLASVLALSIALVGGSLTPAAASPTQPPESPSPTAPVEEPPAAPPATPAPTPSEAPTPGPPTEATEQPPTTAVPTAPSPNPTPEPSPTDFGDDPTELEQRSLVATTPTVQCYGDSMGAGLCGDGFLANALPGYNVIDNSIGGSSSPAIATIAGAYQLSLSATVTIPASGSINLAQPAGLPTAKDVFRALVMDAEIGGIQGHLWHQPYWGNPAEEWRFTRYTPGAATTVAAGTPIRSLDMPVPGATTVIWAGTNSLGTPEQVKRDIAAIVDLHVRTSNAPYFVVTLQPAWEGVGGALYNNRQNVNRWIEATYGERAIPLGTYVDNGALYDAGIFRTPTDVSNIARGLMPRSFWASPTDAVHFNATGYRVLGKYVASFVRDGNTFSNAVSRFDAVSQMNVNVHGSRVTVSGHAYDHSDLLNSIDVGVSINNVWRGATHANAPSPQLLPYGVLGSHSFSWTFELSPGTHSVCSVGVNFGAGDHRYSCTNVTVESPKGPLGDIAIGAGNGSATIYGWSYDPSRSSQSLNVAVLIDGRWHGAVRADQASPYLGIPGQHAYATSVKLSRGQHTACTVAYGVTGQTTTLGCRTFTLS